MLNDVISRAAFRAISPLLIFVIAVSCFGCGSNDAFGTLAAQSMARVQRRDAEALISSFHLPPSYSAEEKQRERMTLRKSLQIVFSDFGVPRDVRPGTEGVTLHVAFGSGDLKYWQAHSTFSHSTYDVRWSDGTAGQFIVVMCNVASKWELRELRFGVRVSEPTAASKIKATTERLVGVLQPTGGI
jgi:hypothetical protein